MQKEDQERWSRPSILKSPRNYLKLSKLGPRRFFFPGYANVTDCNDFRRKNKHYFSNGGNFSAFIDYGGDMKREKPGIYDQETSGLRKYSFTLFDG